MCRDLYFYFHNSFTYIPNVDCKSGVSKTLKLCDVNSLGEVSRKLGIVLAQCVRYPTDIFKVPGSNLGFGR